MPWLWRTFAWTFIASQLAACQFADEVLWPTEPPPGIETEAAQPAAPAPEPEDDGLEEEPLVIIRFDRPDVAYEEPLDNTLREVLRYRPEASFDLVAINPGRGTPAQLALASSRTQRHAEAVLRRMAALGLPPDRVYLSATTNRVAAVAELRLYLR